MTSALPSLSLAEPKSCRHLLKVFQCDSDLCYDLRIMVLFPANMENRISESIYYLIAGQSSYVTVESRMASYSLTIITPPETMSMIFLKKGSKFILVIQITYLR
jgi:hypothetical protein